MLAAVTPASRAYFVRGAFLFVGVGFIAAACGASNKGNTRRPLRDLGGREQTWSRLSASAISAGSR